MKSQNRVNIVCQESITMISGFKATLLEHQDHHQSLYSVHLLLCSDVKTYFGKRTLFILLHMHDKAVAYASNIYIDHPNILCHHYTEEDE